MWTYNKIEKNLLHGKNSRNRIIQYILFLVLQACPGSCEANYNCIECVSFKQGIYNDTMCKERCHNINTVPLLYYEGKSV